MSKKRHQEAQREGLSCVWCGEPSGQRGMCPAHIRYERVLIGICDKAEESRTED